MPPYAVPNLFEVLLPEEDYVGGVDFGNLCGWTGNTRKLPPPPPPYNGYRVIGTGKNPTRVFPGALSTGTIHQSHDCRFAQLDNITLHMPSRSKSYAYHGGMRSRGTNERRPVSLIWGGGALIADEGMPTTGIMGYQLDIYAYDIDVHMPNAVEHGIVYAHGYAERGIALERITFKDGPRSQCIKAVNRPHLDAYADPSKAWKDAAKAGTPFVPNVTIWLRDIYATGYGGDLGGIPSFRGGGFIVLEGSGARYIDIERCFGFDPRDPEAVGFAMDGIYRYYNCETGEPETGFANGDVRINQCAFETTNKPGTSPEPIVRCLNARSLTMTESVAYGEGSKVGIGSGPRDRVGKVEIAGCNTPELKELARRTGLWNVDAEPVLPNGQPLSAGYSSVA